MLDYEFSNDSSRLPVEETFKLMVFLFSLTQL